MLNLSVICPEGSIYEGIVEEVLVPGAVSSFSILKNHAPMVSELSIGLVVIKEKEKKIKFSIESGFVEILNNQVTALVENILYIDDINAKNEELKLQKLLILATSSDIEYERKQRKIKICRMNIHLANDIRSKSLIQ